MGIYTLIILSPIIWVIIFELLKIDKKNITIVIGLELFFFTVFRATTVGGDLVNYLPRYHYINSIPLIQHLQSSDLEPGYVILNKIIATISNGNERLILVSLGLITVLGIAKFIYDNSKIPWLSWYILFALDFIAFIFSALRQSLALAIILQSVKYIKERKLFKFTICVLIAASFHKSAIIFLIVYPISKLKINWKYLIMIFTIFIGLFVTRDIITNFMITQYYGLSYNGSIVEGTGYSMMLLLTVVLVAGLLFSNKLNWQDKEHNILTHMMILALVLQVLSTTNSLFYRVVIYFSVAMVIYIPNVLSTIGEKNSKVIGILTLLSLLSILLYRIFSQDLSGIVPFKFMWE